MSTPTVIFKKTLGKYTSHIFEVYLRYINFVYPNSSSTDSTYIFKTWASSFERHLLSARSSNKPTHVSEMRNSPYILNCAWPAPRTIKIFVKTLLTRGMKMCLCMYPSEAWHNYKWGERKRHLKSIECNYYFFEMLNFSNHFFL